jgi:hypothetical protein
MKKKLELAIYQVTDHVWVIVRIAVFKHIKI